MAHQHGAGNSTYAARYGRYGIDHLRGGIKVHIADQLAGRELGDELLLPRVSLRAEGDLFLCGMTPDALSEKLNVPVRFVPNDGTALIAALLGRECPPV